VGGARDGHTSLPNMVILMGMRTTEIGGRKTGTDQSDMKEAAVCNTHLRNQIDPTCRYPADCLQYFATHYAKRCNTLQHSHYGKGCSGSLSGNCLPILDCQTLQHAATRCNTLQHAPTRCSTLQHATTHCNTLQHIVTRCNTLQHAATRCNTLQHAATRCNKLLNESCHT